MTLDMTKEYTFRHIDRVFGIPAKESHRVILTGTIRDRDLIMYKIRLPSGFTGLAYEDELTPLH